ncbi:MAG: hypothetical protein ORN26_00885, partial [Candidatus Pacebacteria bacterium]|nr:hypothetical protein [Candidatus Paceibacterota bacterium]
MGNIEDKQIQDFYNNCYEHDLDPTYVLKMQKGLGLPDFKKIDILMEWCIKNRINNKSIMQLREGKGIPN